MRASEPARTTHKVQGDVLGAVCRTCSSEPDECTVAHATRDAAFNGQHQRSCLDSAPRHVAQQHLLRVSRQLHWLPTRDAWRFWVEYLARGLSG